MLEFISKLSSTPREWVTRDGEPHCRGPLWGIQWGWRAAGPKEEKVSIPVLNKKSKFSKNFFYYFLLLIGLLNLGFIFIKPLKASFADDFFTIMSKAATPIPHNDSIQLGFFIPFPSSTSVPTVPTKPPATPGPSSTPGPTNPPVPTSDPYAICGIIPTPFTNLTIVPNPSIPGACCIQDGPGLPDQCCDGSAAILFPPNNRPWCNYKPVIYVYPQKPTSVDVTLVVPGRIVKSDPLYPPNGWQNVLAYPDGKLIYQNKIYKELFYEDAITRSDPPEGGIIAAKKDIKSALSSLVQKLGLNKSEEKEFLDYWLPVLEKSDKPYLLISVFSQEQKNQFDKVLITPAPDTFINFILYFKPLSQKVNITPPNLPVPAQRIGFTAVEWGGILDE